MSVSKQWPPAGVVSGSKRWPPAHGVSDDIVMTPGSINFLSALENISVQGTLAMQLQNSGNTAIAFLTIGTFELIQGGIYNLAATVTGTAGLAINTRLVIVNVSSNATITLPAATTFGGGFGQEIQFIRRDTTAAVVTIARAGADTIEGLTSVTLPKYTASPFDGHSVRFQSDGAGIWWRC